MKAYKNKSDIDKIIIPMTENELKECVITKKFECPYKEISGKKCTYCKIPDKNSK